jgi:hypothetical protein
LQSASGGPPFAPVVVPATHVYRVVTQKSTANVYLGTDVGVVKTIDGMSWTRVLTTAAPVRALAIDPANPMTIYDGDDSGEVYRSTTGGQ